jgi:NAD(P)-dependent dehydrogenase (short-subunit alcohol dehydrogenase family)
MTQTIVNGLKPGLRVAVTAGADGIGRAIAETFIAHGARVHVCDISEPALASFKQAHPTFPALLCDVADEAAVDRLFDDIKAKLGGLDVLVNNAGIAGPTSPVEDMSTADWRRTLDVNLTSHFYCTRRAVPMLKAAGDGAIINLSSVAGRLGYAFRLPYAATKWGVVGMTESLAKELGPFGIRVNAILPGPVEGPRIDRVIAARAKTLGVSVEQSHASYVGQSSLKRMVTAQDIANMALFLCTPAGRNISGQPLSVCAGVENI